MDKFKSYGKDASTTIEGLTVETDSTVLTIYGSLDIRKDKEGLQAISRLKKIVMEAEASLLKERDLPDKVDLPEGSSIKNPF